MVVCSFVSWFKRVFVSVLFGFCMLVCWLFVCLFVRFFVYVCVCLRCLCAFVSLSVRACCLFAWLLGYFFGVCAFARLRESAATCRAQSYRGSGNRVRVLR